MNALWSFVQREFLLLLALAAILIFLAIHIIWYIHPSDVKSFADLRRRLSAGKPTVVEFYSNL